MHIEQQILRLAKSVLARNFKRDFVREAIRKFDAIEKKNVLYIPIGSKYIGVGRIVWQGTPQWGILGWFRDSPSPYDYSEDIEHDAVNRFFSKKKYREMPEDEDGLDDLTELVKSLRRTKIKKREMNLMASTSGFMGEYKGKTHDNFFDPKMRVWSYANSETGESLPLIMTELRKQRWNNEDVIWLSAIISPEKQGTGMASKIIKKITDMADKNEVQIWLSPEPFGNVPNALSASKLKSWYKRYGWVKAGGSTMVRYPE